MGGGVSTNILSHLKLALLSDQSPSVPEWHRVWSTSSRTRLPRLNPGLSHLLRDLEQTMQPLSIVSWSHLTGLLWGLKCSDQSGHMEGAQRLLADALLTTSGAPLSPEPCNSQTLATWFLHHHHWMRSQVLINDLLIAKANACFWLHLVQPAHCQLGPLFWKALPFLISSSYLCLFIWDILSDFS